MEREKRKGIRTFLLYVQSDLKNTVVFIANAESLADHFIGTIWRNSKNKSCYRSMHD